jgi:glycosyltransferase involved in cell wall biosynthesis
VRALPTKLFEYLALGLPVIASDFPAWRDIVERHACGICVNPEDPRAIAAAIEYLHDNPEERARLGANARAASAAYTWSRDAPALVALYEEILREQQRRLPHRRSLHHQDG